MDHVCNTLENVSPFTETAAGTMITQIFAEVGCCFIFVQLWRFSLATSIILVAIGGYLILMITGNWANDLLQRWFWRVFPASTKDSSMMPSPVLPEEKPHLEATCTRNDEGSSNFETPTHVEDPFEGAITRLAGAVGLGTEPLIYVRRKDVAEVVDAVVENAKTPGGLSVASTALSRLSILRRSKGKHREVQRSVGSPEYCSPHRGKYSPEDRSADRVVSNCVPRGSGGDQQSTSRSPICSGGSLEDCTQLGEKNAAPGTETKASSGLRLHPTSSPADAEKLLHLLGTSNMSKGDDQGVEHSMWQQILGSSSAVTPVPPKDHIVSNSVPRSSGGDQQSTSSSSVCRGGSLEDCTQLGEKNAASGTETKASSGLSHHPTSSPADAEKLLHLLRTSNMSKGDDQGVEHSMWQQILGSSSAVTPAPSSNVPAAWATVHASPSTSGFTEAKMDSPPSTDNKKISRVSVSTHVASGNEAAFEDIWGAGWG